MQAYPTVSLLAMVKLLPTVAYDYDGIWLYCMRGIGSSLGLNSTIERNLDMIIIALDILAHWIIHL